jgi:ribonucleoside-diphosphate reductase alpha chain
MDDDELPEINQDFEEIAKDQGFYSEALMKKIAQEGSLQNCDEVPKSIKKLFATAHDIPPEWHIEMQAAFQQYVDNAVSKTVNMPENAGKEVVDKIYRFAYKKNCKGVTIYRDGSKDRQVLTLGKSGGKVEEVRPRILPRPRPLATYGMTRKVETGCGDLYVTINKDDKGLPFEIFNSIGKAGGCSASQSEAIGRLVSLALRSNIEPEAVIKHLKGISCHKPRGLGKNKVLSCADAIARALEESLKTDNFFKVTFTRGACPECGGVVEPEGGCIVCRSCGYSECE